jgi:vitamin B12 transporter
MAAVGAAALAASAGRAEESPPEQALPEIVVEAPRLDIPYWNADRATTVITARDMEDRQATSVPEALRGATGLDVVESGGPGKLTDVFIRGCPSEHTLVFLDGMRLNNPVGIGRGYDFGSFPADGVERIEILRGPQSLLYGSDAMAGVVNVVSALGKGRPSSLLLLEVGSYDTLRTQAAAAGSEGRGRYAFSFSRLDTAGFSAAGEKYGNTEADGHGSTAVSGRFRLERSADDWDELIVRYTDSVTDIDDFPGPGGDDPNHMWLSTEAVVGYRLSRSSPDGATRHKMTLNFTGHSSADMDGPDPHDLAEPDSTWALDGRLLRLDWLTSLRLADRTELAFGAELQEEEAVTGSLDERKGLLGIYGLGRLGDPEGSFWTVGARADLHEGHGWETTWGVTAVSADAESRTRVRATAGTGFKTPSLYQLLDPYFGEPSLVPETSFGWDVGCEWLSADRSGLVSVAYFENSFENLIQFNMATWKFWNIGRARTQGLELTAQSKRGGKLDAEFTYTLMATENLDTGKPLLRRPEHKASLRATWRPDKKTVVTAGISYVGEREDVGSTTLEAYTTVDVAAHWDVRPTLRLFAKISNLFDEEYEEAVGYGTAGRTLTAGVRATF